MKLRFVKCLAKFFYHKKEKLSINLKYKNYCTCEFICMLRLIFFAANVTKMRVKLYGYVMYLCQPLEALLCVK